MAKATFRLQQLEYIEYKLDEDFTRDQIREMFPDHKSYPFIVIDEKFIGGYTELTEHMKGL
jgi:glutaredoxin